MITLKEITRDNFSQCIKLQVADDQKQFVASNMYSLAQAKVQDECIPLAIYNDETMIGFFMYCIDKEDNEYWIYRMMIDRAHQGKGYGRQALKTLISRIVQDKNYDKIFIGARTDNVGALGLYQSVGFKDTGEVEDGERILKLIY